MNHDELNNLVVRPTGLYSFSRVSHLLLLAVVFTVFAWLLLPAFILLSLLTCIFCAYRLLLIRSTSYHFTPEVMHTKSGLFIRRTNSLELYRVKDYVVTQNLIMQVFGIMNLTLITTDLTDKMTVLRGIPYSDLPDTLREYVQRARRNSNIVELG